MPESIKKTASSLQNGFAVLEYLIACSHSQGVTEISKAVCLPKATVFRLLRDFRGMGFVEQLPSKRYVVSPGVCGFFNHLSAHFFPFHRAYRLLRAVAEKYRGSVYVSMLAGRRSYVVAASGPRGDTAVFGANGPAYATSSGKVLVSRLPETEWRDYAPLAEERPVTQFTNMKPDFFMTELYAARKEGIAWCERENGGDCSAAVPIEQPGRPPRYAVALLYPYPEWCLQHKEEIKSRLDVLASALGGQVAE